MLHGEWLRGHWKKFIVKIDQTNPRAKLQKAKRETKLWKNPQRNHIATSHSVIKIFRKNDVIISRYAPGDNIEKWLNELLCLNCTDHIPRIPQKLPHPDQCDLFFVERKTLFSFHKQSEHFLQKMMSLYVASHYKNTPNDLVLISDAPAHRLFVLLGPIDPSLVEFILKQSKRVVLDVASGYSLCGTSEFGRRDLKEKRNYDVGKRRVAKWRFDSLDDRTTVSR